MTRDISDLLADAVEDRARMLGDLRPSAARFARTRVRIRRRRVVRHSLEVGAGVAASGAVVAGAWLGLHGDRVPAPPVGTTSPAPSPSSAPTAPPTSDTTSGPTSPTTPEPSATPVEVPGLPSVLPARSGLLDATGPGWLLTVYRSVPAAAAGTAPATANAVIAVAPDGTRYRLADLPPDQQLQIVDWRAGASRARAILGGSDAGTAGWLDLRTGTFQKDDPAAAIPSAGALSFLARLADGTELWQQASVSGGSARLYVVTAGGTARLVGDLSDGGAPTLVNPAGTVAVTQPASADRLVVLRVTDGARTVIALPATNGECHVLGWIDDASVLVQCFDHTGGGPVVSWNPRLVRVDVVAGTLAQLQTIGVGQPFASVFQHGANVSPGAVAFPAYTLDGALPVADVCANGVWQWSAGGLRQVWAMDGSSTASMSVAAAGGYVFFDARPGCQSGNGAPEVVAIGPDGAPRVVAPAPTDAAAWSTELSWTPAR